MRVFQIRVDIYEPGKPYPIVSHAFQGSDEAEATRIHRAHLKTDTFLAACENSGLFMDRVPCRARVTFRGWVVA